MTPCLSCGKVGIFMAHDIIAAASGALGGNLPLLTVLSAPFSLPFQFSPDRGQAQGAVGHYSGPALTNRTLETESSSLLRS